MNEHQKKLYDLLLLTDRIFREHDIQYYLSGGGALGAVRHRGFLPWDDDVDLYLFRWEYEKLMAIREELEANDLVLCDSHFYKWYDDTLPRLSMKDSAMLTKSRIVDGTANGYFMEIFVLDPIPRDPEEKEEWLRKHWLYSEVLKDAYIVANSRVHDYTDEEMYFRYRKRFEEEGREKVLAELEDELFTIELEDANECCSRWGMRNAVYDIDWLGEPKYMLFESAMLPVPNQVEKFLRADFGDSWVMIPQGDSQGTWHNIASNDHISYQKFVDDYMQFIDADEIHKTYIPRKDQRMHLYFDNKNATHDLQVMKQALVTNHYREYRIEIESLQRWVEEEEYDFLDDYFLMWTRTQFNALFRLLNKYVDIGDEYLYYALLPMIHMEQYDSARSVLEWRLREGEIKGKLKDLYDYLKGIADAYQAIYEKDLLEAATCLEKAKKCEFSLDPFNLGYLELYIKIHSGGDLCCNHEAWRDLFQMVLAFPENPELICLLADLEYKTGNPEKAEALYRIAREDNYNGLLLLHIEDQLQLICPEKKEGQE